MPPAYDVKYRIPEALLVELLACAKPEVIVEPVTGSHMFLTHANMFSGITCTVIAVLTDTVVIDDDETCTNTPLVYVP